MSDHDDEEVIPSSSESVRRSKLSGKRLEDTRTKFFRDILRENGVILNDSDRPFVLTKEQSLVIRDIEKTLTQNDDVEENVSKFVTGFKLYNKKSGFLHSCLLPTILRKSNMDDTATGTVHQECLARILLQVNCIQDEIIEFMLNEATEQVGEENGTLDFRLILSSMKYLPFIQTADVVTQKLLDMVEIGTFAAQLEILNSIPEIIPDSQYESTVKRLTQILELNNELTSAIIDCLNSLNLSNDTRIEIQQYIVERLLSSVSIDVFPVLFEFLTSDCKPINLPSVLLKCRDALNDIMRNETPNAEEESRKVVVMSKLNMSAALKVQYDGWMNLLENITNFKTSHKPIDVLLLAMLHSTGSNRKDSVQKLIKRHIRKNLLKRQHLETLFERYFIKQIFCDHFNSLLEIASSLLKSPSDPLSVDFAGAIFVLLFGNENMNQIQRQDILHTLILLTSGWETKNVGEILKILLELSKGNYLKQHLVQLMGLLEKVDMFELNEVRQVFELLCYLTCNDLNEVNSGLKDELHMLIRKQMSSTKRQLKQRGIIAAIIMAKHIAALSSGGEQNEDASEDSIPDISNLPEGPSQESAALLELARNAASTIPELMGLYYDQLASVLVKSTHLDKHFLKWLQSSVQIEFETTYTTDDVPPNIAGVPTSLQYCLNKEDEMTDSFNINIAGLAMQQTHGNPIALLAPLFRMFRMLSDLEDIDALLGCGVILPEVEDVLLYDAEQRKLVADSVFHCVNWFREIANAFCKHRGKTMRSRLINRIGDLVKLEEVLVKCLKHIPDYKVPPSYFYAILTTIAKASPTKTKADPKIGRPVKKLKTNAGETIDFLNDTVASTTLTGTQRKKPIASTSSKRYTNTTYKLEFRELDTDLIVLLKYPINSTNETTVNISVFHYIISDVVNKLDLIVNNKNLGMSNLNDVDQEKLVTDCVKFAPKVFENLKHVSSEIEQLLAKVQHVDDHVDLYDAEAALLKNSFSSCLEYFTLIFSWKGYAQNLTLLKDCLKSLSDGETQSQSIMHFSKRVAGRFVAMADQCLDLQSAVCLVKALDALYRRNTENVEIGKKIATVSGKFLDKKWYNASGDSDRGKTASENLDILIKAYLESANVKTLSGIIASLQHQVFKLRGKDDCLEMLKSVNKITFSILYKNLCYSTLEKIRTEVVSLTNKQHLELWKTAAIIMQGLTNMAKNQHATNNYKIFVQNSNAILRAFLTDGMPILEIMLKSKTDEVIEILKTLQTTTRFLHNLCCTSKLSKNAGIVLLVPKLKATLETLIYRVKAALVANDYSAAFWVGNLRNRDLDGEEILTQSGTSTEVESEANAEEDGEEALPPDDSDEEMAEQENVVEANRNGEERSASEVYD